MAPFVRDDEHVKFAVVDAVSEGFGRESRLAMDGADLKLGAGRLSPPGNTYLPHLQPRMANNSERSTFQRVAADSRARVETG